VEEYKDRDPIDHVLKVLTEEFKVTEAEIEVMNDRVKAQVEECVEFSENSPWPNDDELLKDVYIQEDYPFIVD
jgi:pyruvate dehydrogenase E1 component alpha subunit